MASIAIFTTSRADFPIMEPLVKKLQESRKHKAYLFVGGAHLLNKFGKSVEEILGNKIKITDIFDYYRGSSDKKNIIKTFSKSVTQVNKIFEKYKFDYVILNGDRYEFISIVMNSIIYNKKIIHLSGGEITLGAFDNQIRNMISKCAHYHFVSNKHYKKNLIKMGENKNIFVTGTLDFLRLQKIKKTSSSKDEIFEKFKLNKKKKLALLTYHPETISNIKISYSSQLKLIINCIKKNNLQILLTGGNLDPGFDDFFQLLKSQKIKDVFYFSSLGSDNYLLLMKYSNLMIGNSSSCIAEGPFFKIPTVIIGNRQKGRVLHDNIINTELNKKKISQAIKKALSVSFKKKCKNTIYKFGTTNVLNKIINILNKLNNKDKAIYFKN